MLVGRIARQLVRIPCLRSSLFHSRACNDVPRVCSVCVHQSTSWRGVLPSLSMLLGGLGFLSSSSPSVSKCDVAQGSNTNQPMDASVALANASPRCRRFVAWVLSNEFDVVVFDMDLTMGSGHCGYGLKMEDLDKYIAGASPDFVEAVRVLSKIPSVRLAVATNSDPAEYDLPGQNRTTHILGPDLARALITHWCPDAVHRFEIMIGFDHDCHKDVPLLPGKSWHMRRIAKHYKSSYSRMVLIDDSASRLENTDGWRGVLVRDNLTGFHFEDCFVDDALPPKWRAQHRTWHEPFMRGHV